MHQSEPCIDTHGLLRELGLKEAIAIGLGTMIGAGIFPYAELGEREAPLVEAVGHVAGPVGTAVMLAAAILATLSSANAAVVASSRIG